MSVDTATIDRLREDEEARLDFLIDRGLLVAYPDDTVAASEELQHTREVYADTYGSVDEEEFHATVAELFDLTVEEAATEVEQRDLTRWELATYLSVRSELDVELPQDVVLHLAAIAAAAGEPSPVPPDLETLPGDHEAALAEHGDAVVLVLARGCDPCTAMKEELDETRAALPEGVALFGVDGGTADALRRAYEVEVAPTTLLFSDGTLAEKREGYVSPEDLADLFAATY